MRWLFHAMPAKDALEIGERYAPASLAREGFIHASYKDVVLASAALYFPAGSDLRVLAIDPRRLDVAIDVADTPRGKMPHVVGPIPRDAFRILDLAEAADHPDEVTGTRIAFVAFEGMTLLDLVGPLDAISRIASMGFDPTTTCEVIALTGSDGATRVWSGCGLEVRATRYRPPLDAFDVIVIPGGFATRALEEDGGAIAYLKTFPENRLTTSVCTGALLLGAAGRLTGRRATTHGVAIASLERFGATPVVERVVDEGQLVTAAGVTSGIELGIHVVRRLMGDDVARAIAKQMEVLSTF